MTFKKDNIADFLFVFNKSACGRQSDADVR